jgi:hypothetical protein
VLEITDEPGLSTVITAVFGQATGDELAVEPEVLAVVPLEYGKIVRSDAAADVRGIFPGSGVPCEDDRACEVSGFPVTPVDLNLHIAESDSSERGLSRRLSRVEFTFDRFQSRPDRSHYTEPMNRPWNHLLPSL